MVGVEQRDAGLGAGPADLLADCAVTVMVSVPGALLGAALAGADASLEQVVDDELVQLRWTRKHSRREIAYVCAGDAQGGAHAEFVDVLLGEVGIRAGGARLNTPQAGVDGRRDGRCAKRDAGRHGIQDLLGYRS